MMQLNNDELKMLQKQKREKERRQDNKQHATKIDQGLRSVDSQTGPTRAIWELCQNARDLAEDCHIKIELSKDQFRFSHNGKPFDMDSLSSLIKQVSGQSKETEETVGQYGTGFLTTHYYGMKFFLYGSYQIGEDMYIDLDGFEIDRSHDSIDDLIEKITCQLTKTDELLNKPYSSECKEWTTFVYDLHEHHRNGAVEGLSAAIKQMPYVMLFNDRMTKCQIDDNINNVHMTFAKSPKPDENGMKVMRIDVERNGVNMPMNIYYLESESGEERIVLPLGSPTKACRLDGISKLFMHFPLLGTEDFGFEFIFHSRNFKPEEKRNGLYLPDGNENNQKEAEQNIEVLTRMQAFLFKWLSEHISEIENTKALARLCFNPDKYENEEKADFIEGLRKVWTDFYAWRPMIPTTGGRMSAMDHHFYVLDHEIIQCLEKEGNIQHLYTFCKYAPIGNEHILPCTEECVEWSKIIAGWGELKLNPFIGVKDIAENVNERLDDLHDFLLFVKACKQDGLFTSYALIPNREGMLCKANELRNARNITPDLYKIVRPLIESASDKFVDEAYTDIYEFDDYDRNDLRNDVKNAIDKLREEIANDDGINSCVDEETERVVIDYCSAFPVQNGNSIRNRLMPIICQYQGVNYEEVYIPRLKDDEPDIYENAFRFLVEYIMYKLSCEESEWVEDNLNLLADFVREVTSVETFKKQIAQYAIFPNQYCVSHLAEELRKNMLDEDKCEDLLRIYEKEFEEDLRDGLVHQDFEECRDFDELKAENICKEIEEKLAEDDYSSQTTIEIIEKIDFDEEGWGGLFKNIRDNKQNIFFKNAVSGTKKNDVYRLMKSNDETLAILADLSEQDNMKDILNHAQRIIEMEKQKKADFELMHSIGKHIEDMIREKIASELGEKLQIKTSNGDNGDLWVDDMQYGQDINVSYNGQDVYYIEVKSKRNFNTPAYMSKNQIRKACMHPDKYALCCVDLSNAQCHDINNPQIEEVLPHTRFKNDIGELLLPLVTPVLKADEDVEDREIKLEGDYTASIPKRVFTQGVTMNDMIEEIVGKIQ